MESIVSIIEEFFLPKKRVQVSVRKNKVVISRQLFCSIVIKVESSDSIKIYPIWKSGIIGKFIFYKVYQDQINDYEGIRNRLLNCGYDVTELHIIGSFA